MPNPGKPPKLQPWAEATAKKRMEDLRRDSPEALCLPGPVANLGIGKVVQTPGLLLMLYEGTLYRQIFLDGRELPTDPNPDWSGNGAPATEQLHVTERIRRSDFGHMEVRTTYVDPVERRIKVCVGAPCRLRRRAYDSPEVPRVFIFTVADGQLSLSDGPSSRRPTASSSSSSGTPTARPSAGSSSGGYMWLPAAFRWHEATRLLGACTTNRGIAFEPRMPDT